MYKVPYRGSQERKDKRTLFRLPKTKPSSQGLQGPQGVCSLLTAKSSSQKSCH